MASRHRSRIFVSLRGVLPLVLGGIMLVCGLGTVLAAFQADDGSIAAPLATESGLSASAFAERPNAVARDDRTAFGLDGGGPVAEPGSLVSAPFGSIDSPREALESTRSSPSPRRVDVRRAAENITNVMVMDATLETLGQMPVSRAQHQLTLKRYRLAPGARQPVGSEADTGVGLALFTVEAGQVTVEPDAPVLITRAGADPGSTPDAVPPGTAVVLEVGDQLYAPSGASLVRRNDGAVPAVLLDLSLSSVGDMFRTWTFPDGVRADLGFPGKTLSAFPAMPARATVLRRTLASGAELPIRAVPGLELVYVESGELDLVFDKGGTLTTPERVRTLSAGNGTDVFGRTPERAVLANRSAGPLVLLTASVVPEGPNLETPR